MGFRMIWFLVFVAICAGFALRAIVRGFRGGGFYVWGQRQSNVAVGLAWAVILIAFGLFAATQLGFIPDHAELASVSHPLRTQANRLSQVIP